MEKNINQKQDFKNYFSYIKKEFIKLNTRSSKSMLDRMDNIDNLELNIEKIRFIVECVDFVNRIDKSQIARYSDWWKYIK